VQSASPEKIRPASFFEVESVARIFTSNVSGSQVVEDAERRCASIRSPIAED